jgi:hypothetical protein
VVSVLGFGEVLEAGAFAVLVLGGMRLLEAAGTTLWRTFPARAGMIDGLGRADVGALLASLVVPCAMDRRAAAAFVSRTTGAALAFFGFSASAVDFGVCVLPGEAVTSGTSELVLSASSTVESRASTGTSFPSLEWLLSDGDAVG